MRVKLIRYTPDCERLVAASAKLCYSDSSAEEIEEELSDENVEKFIDKLMDLGHMSPVEHISFTFSIEGVSRTLTHQLVRHRLASFSQKSQRYVRANNYEYIIPPKIENNPKALEIYKNHMQQTIDAYNKLAEILIEQEYEKLLDSGMDEKKARSVAEKSSIEDARYVFANATETKLVMTMNARELLHFFEVRCCQRAQWEIREMATKMLIEVKKVCPHIFKKAGPGCIRGNCPEGKMTCGKIKEVREYYNNLD